MCRWFKRKPIKWEYALRDQTLTWSGMLEMGKDGWELISVTYNGAGMLLYHFKRPLP